VVLHRAPESPADSEYLDLFFTVGAWLGTASIGEPDKCTELVWVDRNRLPSDLVDYVRAALRAVATGQALVPYGWER
jgi:8-oxo-dGTP diphosphatase